LFVFRSIHFVTTTSFLVLVLVGCFMFVKTVYILLTNGGDFKTITGAKKESTSTFDDIMYSLINRGSLWWRTY
jgi:hypothetical protein